MNTSFLNKLHTDRRGYRCTVFLYAYAELNVGDDLFLHKLVSSYPDVRFVMIARKPYQQMFSGYPNVTVYRKGAFLLRLVNKLGPAGPIPWWVARACDYAVYIGGSILQEYPHWVDQHLYYRNLFDNERLYFLGCNWGPCLTKQFEHNMADVLSRMKDVCFRDRYSFNTFSHLPNVRYAPDILLGLDWSRFAQIPEKQQVMLSVVDCTSEAIGLAPYAEQYNRFMARLAEEFAASGCRPILCAFSEDLGDCRAAETIRSLMAPQFRAQTGLVSYQGTNLEQILHLIAESQYIVATRFHAMILGLVAGKQVLPVIYSNKTRNVLEDLSFQGACLDIQALPEDPAGLRDKITRGITDRDRQKLAAQSAGHFARLNLVLRPDTTGA